MCEQRYHGVVKCALGWACWKTYLGRPEADWACRGAITELGNGLTDARRYEDALPVFEAKLSMERRLGGSDEYILVAQNNLARTYSALGRMQDALRMERDVYSGRLKLHGEEQRETLLAANNYASSLVDLQHFEEAKALLRKSIPVARRVLGDSDEDTLRMRWSYAMALSEDDAATLDDLREAVTTLAEIEGTARHVLGGAHPTAVGIEGYLRDARAALRAREAPSPGGT